MSNFKQIRFHYAWVIACVTFLVLLITAGIRATPGVFIVPLEMEFGWTSALISAAIAVNLALYGLIGPFAASMMDRFGLRRVILGALLVLTVSVGLSSLMTAKWQLFLLWGICVGSGTGFTATVLAAVVVNRWFDKHRGLVLGALTAAGATGQLLFLPLMARHLEKHGWRSVAICVSIAAAVVFALVFLLMKDRPEAMELRPYGLTANDALQKAEGKPLRPLAALKYASHSSAFWVLAGSFFVCGASTNGLIGTHLIPACHDFGITEVHAAGLLATMGVFDILGTTASGWLSDRMSSRYLLFTYYVLRGLSLLFLPWTLAHGHDALNWFAIFYGLDWVATVPPTVRMVSDCFGRQNAGVIFGWIGAAHQLGAASAAIGAGMIRTHAGSYNAAFWTSGVICLFAGTAILFSRRSLQRRKVPPAKLPNEALATA